MQQKHTSLGLMSGTSGDGVDASIIVSNGVDTYESIEDKFYEYDNEIYDKYHILKEKINNPHDLKKFEKEIRDLERIITIFHAKVVNDLIQKNNFSLVGFHGQTIYHNAKQKISYQLGDAKLLYQLTKKKTVFNFRKNDILNGGEGAPLTPVFHKLLSLKKNFDLPVCILNIGGISNITIISNEDIYENFFSKDIGPGNCLIDTWIRKNSKKKFDKDGLLASLGKKNEIILEQAQELYANRINKEKISLDVNDFDISFARGLSLEDGARTITEFSANLIGGSLRESFNKFDFNIKEILLCGGGRKNIFLIDQIKKYLSKDIKLRLIDEYKINGDFIESQAFGFLAIRSLKKLPLTFPDTTNCKKPCSGGELIQN